MAEWTGRGIRGVSHQDVVQTRNILVRDDALAGLQASGGGHLTDFRGCLGCRDTVSPYENGQSRQDNEEEREPIGGSVHGPLKESFDQFPHGRYPEWAAWAFILRAGVMLFLFLVGGLWLFRRLYIQVWLAWMPDAHAWLSPFDVWAFRHGPVVLTGIIPVIGAAFLLIVQSAPWVLGFGASFAVALGFYRATVRFGKLPPWSAYPEVFTVKKRGTE